jgi:hypothetical protein
MARKTVLLLGAGASVADVATKSLKSRPPLDRRFFSISTGAVPGDGRIETVRSYMDAAYGIDILAPEHDSLEGVMARIYPDLFNDLLEVDALTAFRALLRLFTDRLATTTNEIRATQKRFLYRMLSRLLSEGCDPAEITIVTFNQDLQVEKVLEHVGEAKRWDAVAARLFSFPEMYSVQAGTWESITGPTGGDQRDLFPRTDAERDCLRVLKLHGSLNWYSTHTSTTPSRTAMFRPTRRLSVTRRRTIAPDMALSRKARTVYTLPVVVPPVTHKSSVLHGALARVWTLAEQRLVEADDLIVFGYSCPPLDFESANLLARAQRQRSDASTLSVIDPAGSVATRYIDLLAPKRMRYYASAQDFLR